MNTITVADPLLDIQQGIYRRLTGDAALGLLVTGIFDEVPEGQTYPYVVLGEVIATPRNAHGSFGREVVATLHVWDRFRGYSRGLAIMNRVVALLDHQPLTLAGHVVVSVRFEFSQTLRDPDPEIRHIPVRFRVTTEQE